MSITPFTVGVVDDDSQLRQAIMRLLKVSGHEVLGFDSAEAFLAAAPAQLSCLVLDIDLGGMNGIDLYRQLREQAAPPVIFISGNREPAHALAAQALGAADFLHKPFDATALIAAVRRACENGNGA